jgi:hypothetical protein
MPAAPGPEIWPNIIEVLAQKCNERIADAWYDNKTSIFGAFENGCCRFGRHHVYAGRAEESPFLPEGILCGLGVVCGSLPGPAIRVYDLRL